MKSTLNEPGSNKRVAVVIALVVGVALLGWGGWHLYGKFTSGLPTTAQLKRSIWKVVTKKAHEKKFHPAVDIASASLLTDAPSQTTTNKAGRVKTTVKTTKSASLELPETTLSNHFRTNQQQTASYEAMYRVLGEQLTVADQLLESPELARRVVALVMAGEASIYARTNAEDLGLSARICEAYIWPNLSLVDATNRTPVTPDALLNLCDIAFKDAGETNHIIQNYNYMLAKTQRPTGQLDASRFRLAQIYMDLGEKAKALKLLKEIKTIKTAKIDREIAQLERELSATKP